MTFGALVVLSVRSLAATVCERLARALFKWLSPPREIESETQARSSPSAPPFPILVRLEKPMYFIYLITQESEWWCSVPVPKLCLFVHLNATCVIKQARHTHTHTHRWFCFFCCCCFNAIVDYRHNDYSPTGTGEPQVQVWSDGLLLCHVDNSAPSSLQVTLEPRDATDGGGGLGMRALQEDTGGGKRVNVAKPRLCKVHNGPKTRAAMPFQWGLVQRQFVRGRGKKRLLSLSLFAKTATTF